LSSKNSVLSRRFVERNGKIKKNAGQQWPALIFSFATVERLYHCTLLIFRNAKTAVALAMATPADATQLSA